MPPMSIIWRAAQRHTRAMMSAVTFHGLKKVRPPHLLGPLFWLKQAGSLRCLAEDISPKYSHGISEPVQHLSFRLFQEAEIDTCLHGDISNGQPSAWNIALHRSYSGVRELGTWAYELGFRDFCEDSQKLSGQASSA